MAKYLYIMATHPGGPCKIGISGDVGRRQAEGQTWSADILRVWLRFHVRNGAEELEDRVHAALAPLRTRDKGEWFNLTVEEAVVAVRGVSGLSRRWSLSAIWARLTLRWRLWRASR